jgi:hypothetical protein
MAIHSWHGLINFIDTKAKCRHLKTIYLYRDFVAGVYLSDTPPLSPFHGGGGTREKVRGATVHKAGSKTNMTDWISSLLSRLNTYSKVPFAGQFVR